MKLRWKIIIPVVVFVVVCGAVVPLLAFKAKRAVEVYKKQLVANGEKMSIGDLVERAGTNGNAIGEEFLDCAGTLPGFDQEWLPTPMRMVSPGRALVSWQASNFYDESAWKLMRANVEKHAEATEALRATVERGKIVFPIESGAGFRSPQPHLGPLRQAVVWLAMSTVFELHEGNNREAGENLLAILRALENYDGEPAMMSQFVRALCVQIAFNTTWEVLQVPGLSEGELEEIQKAWGAVRFDSAEKFFAFELANGSERFEAARKSAEIAASYSQRGGSASLLDDVADFAAGVTTDPGAALKTLMNRPNQRLWRWVISYEEELFTLKVWRTGLGAARDLNRKGYCLENLKRLDTELEKNGSRDGFVMGESRNVVRTTLGRLTSARIGRQLAITGCALHRFKLKNGNFPSRLGELVPGFLREIPIDPVDGAPLRYRQEADGSFRLYSVGENGIDEGGDAEIDARRENSYPGGQSSSRRMRWSYLTRGRDWVWPQPATKEDILNRKEGAGNQER